MSERKAIEAELAAIGKLADDAAIDIGRSALALAALDHPALSLAPYQAHLQTLVSDAAALAGGRDEVAARAAALSETLHHRHGYVGDALTYDDPQNANLIRVIDRRRGLPVALGILYLHVARAQGWALTGLNFPGHFLLRLDSRGKRLILDPFRGGATLGPEELRTLLKQIAGSEVELEPWQQQPVSARDVLLRLQNNIKTRALQAGEPARATEVLRAMLLFAPTQAPLWRELGLIESERGNLQSAAAALQACVEHAADPGLQRDAAALLQRLRRRLN